MGLRRLGGGSAIRDDSRTAQRATSRRPALVERPALQHRLDEAFGKRVTAVVADAGFGKSTLLQLWAADLDAVWYELGPRDRSAGRFAAGLLRELHGRISGHARRLEELIAGSPIGEGERDWADMYAAALCEALNECLDHDLMLIVDDVHELGAGAASARLLETLARQAPPLLHLVLSSRQKPPFAIARLRGQGAVLELDAEALAFSEDEVAELLERTIGAQGLDLAPALREATGGWPAAVRLALETLAAAPEQARPSVVQTMRSGGPIFSYFAEEVFAREPAEVRRLIRAVAAFDRVRVDLCEAIGLENARETLPRLAERGLLVRAGAATGSWFELHALVRAFARERWPLSDDESRALHRCSAQWFERAGMLAEALTAWRGAGDAAGLRSFAIRNEVQLLHQGLAEAVIPACETLPESLRDEHVEKLLGEAWLSMADVPRALDHLQRAAGAAATLSPALALPLGLAVWTESGPGEAIKVFRRVSLDEPWTAAHVHVAASTARHLALMGQFDAARADAKRALEIAESLGEPEGLAAAYHAFGLIASQLGDRDEARRWYERELPLVEHSAEKLSLSNVVTNLGWGLFEEGRLEDALEHMERAVALLAGFTDLSAYARSNVAICLAALGRLDEARAEAEWAATIYQRMRSPRASRPLMTLGEIELDRGRVAAARAVLEDAVEAAERTDELQYVAPALAALARALAADDPERAHVLAHRASSLGSGPWVGSVLVARGWVELQAGAHTKAAGTAREAVAFASERAMPAALASARELAAATTEDPVERRTLLERSLTAWRELKSPLAMARCELAVAKADGDTSAARRAERRLRELGVHVEGPHAPGLLATLPAEDPAPVAIRTLGGFHVLRAGEPVAQTEWQSRKARDLLKLLVARRGRPVARELVIEALWPGEDPVSVSSRLSVAMSTVRSLLDPQKALDPHHYVSADRETISLVRAHLDIDVEVFLAEAAAGLADRDDARLEYAESIYAGDFLEGDPYSDWAVPLREEARSAYIDATRALADRAARCQEDDRALRYLRRIVEREPYDERAHLDLVGLLERSGRRGHARRHYRAYTARMEEIGVEPSPFPAPG